MMADTPASDPSSPWFIAVWLTVGGGGALIWKTVREWRHDREVAADAKVKAAAAAPEVAANVEARAVTTAREVIDLVDELVAERLAPIKSEVDQLRTEANRLRSRVGVLEDELRAHNIPIPPIR